MTSRILLAALLALPFSWSAFAEEKSTDAVFTDPANAGPDFAVQGEYTGDNCAAQVIALGDGKFHIVGWSKGLPGVAADAEKKVEVDAQRDGDKVTFDGGGWKGKIESGQLLGTNDQGRTFELHHILRQSSTLGAKPPAGAVVLYDGTNADAWAGGHMDERKFLAGGTKSKQKFGDFTLHVEFLIPFKPAARGQARGNSGVYLQDRYEVQVLDSFGLKGENNECGGIYTKVKPLLNACFPPLSWQTYDVDFEAARYDAEGKKTKNAIATIRHNGILIHDHVEINGSTGGGQKETPEPGPIQLQGHGNPVYFQNIWIVEKKQG
jgi:hypothetical protein